MIDLFDYAKSRRDVGMQIAANAQDTEMPNFTEMAYRHILGLARDHREIHIDLFLASFKLKPSHPNAFGAPWQRAKRNGIIQHSGRVRPCTVDPMKNAHLYPVYTSLIFGKSS